MTRPTDPSPAPVPDGASPAGEVRARWAWTEPTVWSERMLTALERGVKGGRWFSLIDKVYAPRTLRAAFARVKANRGRGGVDHVTVDRFEAHLDDNLARLHRSLAGGTYRPQAIRRVWVPKPGRRQRRPLGIPTVRDRVVQTALRFALEPVFERDFAEHSYGFRPRRGCMDALRRVHGLLREGTEYVVDADLESYFDTIPHEGLMARVRERVSDGRVLALIEAFLEARVLDGAAAWTPERGSPQGAVISPLLSNLYLDPLDHLAADHGLAMTRYADDFVIQCRTLGEAHRALAVVKTWTASAGLRLHPTKTRIVHAYHDGFDFLGYHFGHNYIHPSSRSLRSLKDTIRAKTHRGNGHSLEQTITDVNRTLRGWWEYFRASHWTWLRDLDKWTRMRLRSILRARQGRRGRARGRDHHRWPIDFFTAQGLFSTLAATGSHRRSSWR